MERLTEYDEFGNAEFVGIDNTKLYERLVCDETVALTIATNKLAKLEDVLGKYGIDNLDDFIKEYSSRNIKLANDNYNLEQELAELKQKAIVLEKAFEFACDPRDDWGGEKYSGTEFNNYHDYFIAEAEQKLAEIGGKNE